MKRTNKVTNEVFSILLCLTAVVFTTQTLAQGGTWETKAPMPTPRYGPAIGVINDKLYVASGGCTSNYYPWPRYNVVEAYDPSTDSWSTHAPILTAIYEAASGVIDSNLYVAGGQADAIAGANQDILQVYDPVADTWVFKAPMPARSANMAGGVINGKLYVAGGMNPSNTAYVDTLLVYDPAIDAWTPLAPMPAPRSHAAAGVIDNILYVAGGGSTSTGFLATLEAYDPATDTWTTKAPMPTARGGAEASVINGILYVVGGYDSSAHLATVEAYDPATNTWTTEVPMPTARALPAVGAVNNKLYAIGGTIVPGDLGSAINEAFTPDISALIDIEPDTINKKSHGKWITVYITLPDGLDVGTIDTSSIAITSLTGETCDPEYIQEADPNFAPQVGDRDEDGILDLTVKFDRQVLLANLCLDDVSITIEGELTTGEPFTGSDSIRIIDRGK